MDKKIELVSGQTSNDGKAAVDSRDPTKDPPGELLFEVWLDIRT